MGLVKYSVILNGYSGSNKVAAKDALVNVCGYIEEDAENIINDLPQEILVDIDSDVALKVKKALEIEGLDIEIVNEKQSTVEYDDDDNDSSDLLKTLALAGLISSLNRRPRRYRRPRPSLFGSLFAPPRRPMAPRPHHSPMMEHRPSFRMPGPRMGVRVGGPKIGGPGHGPGMPKGRRGR